MLLLYLKYTTNYITYKLSLIFNYYVFQNLYALPNKTNFSDILLIPLIFWQTQANIAVFQSRKIFMTKKLCLS
jgi:hypothetical protein